MKILWEVRDESKTNANGGDWFSRDPAAGSGGGSVRICGDESVELAGSGSIRRQGHHVLAGGGSAGAEPDSVRRILQARRAAKVADRRRLGAADAGRERKIPSGHDAEALRGNSA